MFWTWFGQITFLHNLWLMVLPTKLCIQDLSWIVVVHGFFKINLIPTIQFKSNQIQLNYNPQRAKKADKSRWQEHYQYKVAQYNYYNIRKKIKTTWMPMLPYSVLQKYQKSKSIIKFLQLESENLCKLKDYEKPNLDIHDERIPHH